MDAKSTTILERITKPEEIERELLRLWREAAEQDAVAEQETIEDGREPAPRVRAILSNLIIVTRAEGEHKELEEHQLNALIEDLCVCHPSRFFIVRLAPESHELHVRVSSRCVLASSGSHVCSEEVHLRAGRGDLRGIPSLLMSLFVPDVPGILMVLGDFMGDQLPESGATLELLEELVDVVVFDSSFYSRFFNSAKRFSRQRFPKADKPHRTPRVRDINWYRTERWRSLIAEQFDSPALEPLPGRVKSVKIYSRTHRSELVAGRVPAQSLLLAGWIMLCLDWSLDKVEQITDGCAAYFHTKKKGKAQIEFLQEPGVETGEVGRIELSMSSTKGSVVLAITQSLAEHCYSVMVDSEDDSLDIPARRVTYHNERLSQLAIHIVRSSGVDDQFGNSFNKALDIAELLSAIE